MKCEKCMREAAMKKKFRQIEQLLNKLKHVETFLNTVEKPLDISESHQILFCISLQSEIQFNF